jgi:hypothetical protein
MTTDLPLNEEIAALALQHRVDRELPKFRARLFRLNPVMAMGVLGSLTSEAFTRIPPAQRMAACTAWTDAISQGVRDSLG